MADVYAAQDELLNRSVAVKVFYVDGPADNERRRVEVEIQTLARLRHPGLVTVFDAGVVVGAADDATPFLVMELIHGQTLRQRLADGAVPSLEAARLGAGLAETLAYVHAQAVVHRDVKPANVLLDDEAAGAPRYAAKLTDFGIARLVDSTRLTMVGMTIGTANYLSPEQATGHAVGPASDVYSLGLVLLECLTGALAYPGTGVEAAMARLNRAPAIPTTLGPGWVQLLGAMTDRNPDLRPSASVAAQALGELAERGAMAGSTVPVTATVTEVIADADRLPQATRLLPARKAPRGPRSRWQWLVGAGAMIVVVLLIVLLVNLIHRGSAGSPAPAPSYPSVSGPIGSDLRQLEGAVG